MSRIQPSGCPACANPHSGHLHNEYCKNKKIVFVVKCPGCQQLLTQVGITTLICMVKGCEFYDHERPVKRYICHFCDNIKFSTHRPACDKCDAPSMADTTWRS